MASNNYHDTVFKIIKDGRFKNDLKQGLLEHILN